MYENITPVDKDIDENDNPFVSLLNKVNVVKPRDGRIFSGKLIKIQGSHLIFEMRSGLKLVLHTHEVMSAFEIKPRRE
jgi:hypothetical protein